jgi:hypothetical protein
MKLRWSFLFLALLFPFTASAEIFAENSGITGDSYFGVNAQGLRYSQDDDFDAHEAGLGLRLGHQFGNYLAVEGHATIGLDNDTSAGVEVGVDYLAGVYLRGNIFLWDPRARIYGLVGVTYGKVTKEAFGLSDTTTDTEPGFGFGFEFYGDDRNAFNVEFMRYMDGEEDDENYEVDAFNLGYTHRF